MRRRKRTVPYICTANTSTQAAYIVSDRWLIFGVDRAPWWKRLYRRMMWWAA